MDVEEPEMECMECGEPDVLPYSHGCCARCYHTLGYAKFDEREGMW